jgi:hypothetical protein
MLQRDQRRAGWEQASLALPTAGEDFAPEDSGQACPLKALGEEQA